MATDTRDPRFLETLRQLGNSEAVTGYGSSTPPADPQLRYDMSGALDPRPIHFPAQNDRMVFYHPAKEIVIPDRIKGALNDVAEEFFYRTDTPLFINSGRRNPITQARAMYRKFRNNVRGDYTGPRGKEIIGIYDHAVAGRYDEGQTLSVMTQAIQNQVERGEYVSPHLRDNAVDIRWQDTPARRNILREISERRGHTLVDEGFPKHHHLTFRIHR